MMTLFRLLLLVCVGLGFVVSSPGQSLASKRVALVIGNGAYVNAAELANPPHDAEDMAEALKGVGFTVILGVSLDKAKFDAKLIEISEAISGADVGVFYYSGHGLQVGGVNYLVPTDAKLTTPAALDFEMVRLDLVQRIMEREASTNILFLDACRNDPFARNLARSLGTRGGEVGRGLAPAESGTGTLISYSTQPNNVALDGEGRNSPYTGPLVKRIVSEGQDILELLRQVRKDVLTATGNKQIPWDTNALTEKFYFNMTIEIGPAPAPTTIQPEAGGVQAEWAIVKDTNSAEVLKAFKEKYKDQDLYVALADERLAMLIQKSPPNVTPPAAATPQPAPPANPEPAPSSPMESKAPEEHKVAAINPKAIEDLLNLDLSQRAKIQAVLAKGGAKIGYIGGIYGEDTRSAIRDYQRSRGDTETGFLTAGERDILVADFKKAGPLSFPYFMNLTPDDLGPTPDPRLAQAVAELSSAQIRYIYIGDTLYIPAIEFGTDWNTAEQKAEAAGGRLAIISTAAINDKITKLYYGNPSSFTTQQNPEGKTLYNGAWIGLIRDPSAAPPREGWHWVDGSKLRYRNWLSDSPGQWDSKVPLNCARFQSHPSPDPSESERPHQWGNTNCNESFNSFVIEIPK